MRLHRLQTLGAKPFVVVWVFALFVFGLVISTVIPPFQSPDERDHLRRAYFLTQGQVLLERDGRSDSGGQIDSGLEDYFAAWRFTSDFRAIKISHEEVQGAKLASWTGRHQFAPAPGTGYYFPALYAPQAAALLVGKWADLSIDASYRLARLAALATTTLVLLAAFALHTPSPLALWLLAIPMTAFQMAAASLDGLATAVAVLAISVFLRIAKNAESARTSHLLILALSVFLVAACRTHLLPLVLLIFAAYPFTRDRRYLIAGCIVLGALLAWMAVTITSTVDTRIPREVSASGMIAHYAKHPVDLLRILYRTWTDPVLLRFYLETFFGVLGWLAIYLEPSSYRTLYVLTALAALLSLPWPRPRPAWGERTTLVLCAGACTLLVFLALLAGWTKLSAGTIQGVQGRYFLVPALLLAYALHAGSKDEAGWRAPLGIVVSGLFLVFSFHLTTRVLADAYYLPEEAAPIHEYTLKPSAPLQPGQPIELHFSEQQRAQPKRLYSISLLFGTYGRKNLGEAELTLRTASGTTRTLKFPLESLRDNRYAHFELDGQAYVAGTISAAGGGGVSLWEVEAKGEGKVPASCLMFEMVHGVRGQTKGCPGL